MEDIEYEKMYNLEKDYWWWVGRRHLFTGIISRLNLNSPNILDIGCGTGINLRSLEQYGAVTGVDNSECALAFCGKRGHINVLNADADNLPFQNSTFDLITALDLLEHVDDNQVLNEFRRILKPDGYLMITVPAFNFMWSQHDEAVHHKRRYVKRDLISILMKNGFLISKISYWNFFTFPIVSIVRIVKNRFRIGSVTTDTFALPKVVNSLLVYLLCMESWILKCTSFPFGVSLICLARVNK